MPTTLPAVLPARLTAYRPGRIALVAAAAWPSVLDGPFEPGGVRITVPRYALDLRTCRDDVDPHRVRWLADGSTIRPVTTRTVPMVPYRRSLWVVGGHTVLAAHLAAGTEDIPVRLLTPVRDAQRVQA